MYINVHLDDIQKSKQEIGVHLECTRNSAECTSVYSQTLYIISRWRLVHIEVLSYRLKNQIHYMHKTYTILLNVPQYSQRVYTIPSNALLNIQMVYTIH